MKEKEHFEIGSEFWDIPISSNKNNLFENATWFISGRTALRAIIEQIIIEHRIVPLKVALPSYLCESMIEPFLKENVEFSFYSVFVHNGIIDCDYSNVYDCNAIVVMDYFGFDSQNLMTPHFSGVVIRDLTHSIFTKKYDDADYYFGSLRKWAGFLCGGFARKNDGKVFAPNEIDSRYVALRREAMAKKKDYIYGQTDSKDYLNTFHEAEELLSELKMAVCNSNDIDNANRFGVDFVKRRRRENANYLIENLNEYSLFKRMGENDCPLCVPILYKNRDALRKFLISKEIYCPIHWPKPVGVGDASNLLYEQELSLPCDQRYTVDDMKRIVYAVKEYMESEKSA